MLDVLLECSRNGLLLGLVLAQTARFLDEFVVNSQVRSHV
jgi:hypothetical protein